VRTCRPGCRSWEGREVGGRRFASSHDLQTASGRWQSGGRRAECIARASRRPTPATLKACARACICRPGGNEVRASATSRDEADGRRAAIDPLGRCASRVEVPQIGPRVPQMLVCDAWGADFRALAVQLRPRESRNASTNAAWGLGFRRRSALRIGGDGLLSPPRPCPWTTAWGVRLRPRLLALSRLPRSPGLFPRFRAFPVSGSSLPLAAGASIQHTCDVAVTGASDREDRGNEPFR
jgi:hypothetical protein